MNAFDMINNRKREMLEESNEKMYNELSSKISELKDEIRQLEEFNRDMHCCGNCDYEENECILKKSQVYPHGYCKNWKFDGTKQKDRKI